MSLKAILNCADEEFEKFVRELDGRGMIDAMNEIIAEMDREQSNFDSLTSQISSVKDQLSAEFKDISSELIKSQNRLALLMARNMFCFNIQSEDDSTVQPKPIVIKQTRPNSVPESQNGSPATAPTTKRKVVKVTKITTRKVVTDTENLDPQLKSIMESRRNQIKNYKKPSQTTTDNAAVNGSSVKPTKVSPNALDVNMNSVTETSSIQLTPVTACVSPPNRTLVKVNGYGKAPAAAKHSADADADCPVSNIDDIIAEDNSEKMKAAQLDGSAASSDTDTSSAAAPDLAFDFNSNDFEPEKVKDRIFMKSWNPVKILDELYAIKLAKENSLIRTDDVINIEGYLEQLPVGKRKTTLLKTWKRVYCRAKDGVVYFYKSKSKEAEFSSFLSVMGGELEEFSNKMIGIDDKRGHYLMVRCPSEAEYRDWLRSLYTQIKCSPTVNYIRPTLTSSAHPSRVVVIDLGSCSVRAGVLGTTPSYPQLFFPCITTVDNSGNRMFGFDCYKPENRANGLQYPVAVNKKVDKYRVNVEVFYDLFCGIFTKLGVAPSEHTVMLSTPHNFSTRLKEEILNVLFTRLGVAGANIVNQSLLTPYIYNATSGIVVDIGERIEIVAITDGYLMDGDLNRRSFGGSQITANLGSSLMEYRLHTAVENLIVRLIKEKTCFVSQDYDDELLECMVDNSLCQATVDLEQFSLPEGTHLKLITVDVARFKAPEGLLRTELLGVDSPTLPQLIQQAVAKCPMDLRREMWQSIYLSGGTTLIEGFPQRLEAELAELAPPTVTVQVHASPHRYHAAYIGACMLAKSPNFSQSCITREEWLKGGKRTLNKWKYYFQG